ncbi:MAG: hypothetical protein SGCHY_005216, partial [Lobulomycetales sp.]
MTLEEGNLSREQAVRNEATFGEDIDEDVDDTNSKVSDDDEEGKFEWTIKEDIESKKGVKGLPILIRFIIRIIIGWSVLAIPGLVSFLAFSDRLSSEEIAAASNGTSSGDIVFDEYRASGFSIEGLPAFYYVFFLAVSWTSLWALKYASIVVPEMLIRLVNLFTGVVDAQQTGVLLTHYLDYFKNVQQYVAFTTYSIANVIVWRIMFPPNSEKPSNLVIARIFTVILIGSIVWTIEKFILQLFSGQFHQRAYADRIEAMKKTSKVLEVLDQGVKKRRVNKGFLPGIFKAKSSNESEDRVGKSLGKLNGQIAQKATHIGTGLIEVGMATVGYNLEDRSGIRHFGDPFKLAKRLFQGIQRGKSNSLYLQDFEPFFETLDESVEAFRIFDGDGNGDITRVEFRQGILEIYNDCDSLEASVLQSNQAIAKLDSLLKVFVYAIIIFVALGTFEIDTSAFLALTVTLWAGTLFAIGGVVKNLVESIIFLFFTHPFDVADRVCIDGEVMNVKSFGL